MGWTVAVAMKWRSLNPRRAIYYLDFSDIPKPCINTRKIMPSSITTKRIFSNYHKHGFEVATALFSCILASQRSALIVIGVDLLPPATRIGVIGKQIASNSCSQTGTTDKSNCYRTCKIP
jgi:hypothetical protein